MGFIGYLWDYLRLKAGVKTQRHEPRELPIIGRGSRFRTYIAWGDAEEIVCVTRGDEPPTKHRMASPTPQCYVRAVSWEEALRYAKEWNQMRQSEQ